MILFKKAAALRQYVDRQHRKGIKTGFVPTMGALHEGHISLVKEAKKATGCCIASIFVNPTQFNDPADFKKYPITLEQDIRMLTEAGCDILFQPSVEEVYPEGIAPQAANNTHYDLGYLETILEGKYRPGHFQGVCAVVHRLLAIVQPQQLFLGQKDYQQCLVIGELIKIIGMDDKLQLSICPTLREKDGLAMSSRNRRLTTEERKKAPAIFRSLRFIKDTIKPGNLEALEKQSAALLVEEGFRVDYITLADAASLEPVINWDGRQPLVALAAAFLNEVRLIDNLLLEEPSIVNVSRE